MHSLTFLFAACAAVGMVPLFVWRGRGALLVAIASPVLAAVAFWLGANQYWTEEARRVVAASGEEPCGAFGMLQIFSMFAGAFVEYLLVGLVAFVRYRRSKRLRLERGSAPVESTQAV